jgi:hypothetical protein
MLSSALQAGNAHVATQGASDLLLHAYRVSCGLGGGAAGSSSMHAGPGRYQQRRAEQEAAAVAASVADGLGSIVHADYCSARAGVRTGMAA